MLAISVASADARSAPGAAVEGRRAGTPIALSRRPRQSSRLQDRMVVLHGQSRRGRRPAVRLSATFFRVGVDPAPANPSRWAVRDLFMAHLALTDINGRRFRFTERSIALVPDGPAPPPTPIASGTKTGRRRWMQCGRIASGRGDGRSARPPSDEAPRAVLHGDRGYSRKGSAPGNASHYYSLTRMPTPGTVTLDGRAIEVTGQSWMDHEFGTSFLETGAGWMGLVFHAARRWPRSDDVSVATARRLHRSAIERDAGRARRRRPHSRSTAVSPRTRTRVDIAGSGARYPLEWRLRRPGESIDLSVRAVSTTRNSAPAVHRRHVLGGSDRRDGQRGRATGEGPRLSRDDRIRRARSGRIAIGQLLGVLGVREAAG